MEEQEDQKSLVKNSGEVHDNDLVLDGAKWLEKYPECWLLSLLLSHMTMLGILLLNGFGDGAYV